jgi:lipopolysaccharide export system permease protein
MKIIERYLGKIISLHILIIVFVISVMFFVLQLLNETRELDRGQYHLLGAINYVLLTLPEQLYLFFPVASLLGCMLGFNLLARHSELVILRVSTLSLYRLTWGLLKTTLPLIIIATLIGEGIAPWASRFAERYKTMLTSNGQTLMTQQGSIWMRDQYNFLYIKLLRTPKELWDVNRYQFDAQNNLLSVRTAKRLRYEHEQWIAYEVKQTILSDQGTQIKQLANEVWPLTFNPRVLRNASISENQMSLKQLWQAIHDRHNSFLNISQFSFAFWQRVIYPLTIMLMLSLAMVFSIFHTRHITGGIKIILGIMLGIGFYLFNTLLSPFVLLYQWPPLLAAVIPFSIFSLLTLSLMRYTR